MKNNIVLQVVCAIIKNNGKILAVRRKKGEKMEGLWEFPGGKIEHNEEPFLSISREIMEELEINIHPVIQLNTVIYQYPDFIIHLTPIYCQWLSGKIRLKVHDQYRWVLPENLKLIQWSEADIKIVDQLFLMNLD